MGKNLKKVIFSVLLLAAVIVVSPKDAKAAGKVWMAGFNDNSITIQWTPQSLNGYRAVSYTHLFHQVLYQMESYLLDT